MTDHLGPVLFPLDPIFAKVDGGPKTLAAVLVDEWGPARAPSARTISRWKAAGGVDDELADRLAVSILGEPPEVIWPVEWQRVLEADPAPSAETLWADADFVAL